MSLPERVGARLDRLLPDPGPVALGLAVSGGSDSMALLHLAALWAKARAGAVRLRVATVDHGLRLEAAAEARDVARAAAALGFEHDTLRWRGWDGRGNLQAAARAARRALLRRWAERHGLGAVALAHTRDDQAETVLLRLARGSGVDGLAAMPPARREGALLWLRPLLEERRDDLRAWLHAQGIGWCEDPSNEDSRFDRVRARRMLAELAPLGLSAARLAAAAAHMGAAQEVLDDAAAALARAAVRQQAGALVIDIGRYRAARTETRHRLLAAALGWISGRPHRPRHAALRALDASLCGTLHGARVMRRADRAMVLREIAALARMPLTPPRPAGRSETPGETSSEAWSGAWSGLWDGRWHLTGPATAGDEIGPLGRAGLAALPDWRAAGLPAEVLAATPAVWRGDRLVAAPLAGASAGWRATLAPGRDNFVSDAFGR